MQIDKEKLLGLLKKELEFCRKEKFSDNKKSHFFVGRETVFTDIIAQIDSGNLDDLTIEGLKGELERLKEENKLYNEGLIAIHDDEKENLRQAVERYRKVLERLKYSGHVMTWVQVYDAICEALGNHL